MTVEPRMGTREEEDVRGSWGRRDEEGETWGQNCAYNGYRQSVWHFHYHLLKYTYPISVSTPSLCFIPELNLEGVWGVWTAYSGLVVLQKSLASETLSPTLCFLHSPLCISSVPRETRTHLGVHQCTLYTRSGEATKILNPNQITVLGARSKHSFLNSGNLSQLKHVTQAQWATIFMFGHKPWHFFFWGGRGGGGL